jgi:hypothetical protein
MCHNHNVLAPLSVGGLQYVAGDVVTLDCDNLEWLILNAPGKVDAEPTDAPATHYRMMPADCGACAPVQVRVETAAPNSPAPAAKRHKVPDPDPAHLP